MGPRPDSRGSEGSAKIFLGPSGDPSDPLARDTPSNFAKYIAIDDHQIVSYFVRDLGSTVVDCLAEEAG